VVRAILIAAVALLVPGAAFAVASDFDHPASSETRQQFEPPPAPAATNPQRGDKPNDPEYDSAEPDGNTPHVTNFYDERFDLFGFPSALTPLATYSDGPNASACTAEVPPVPPPCRQIAGFNAAGAWKLTRGRPDAVIAILDTGIKWDRDSLRTQIHLNTAELPLPQGPGGVTHPGAPMGGFDLNANGAIDVDDFKDDPRVTHTGPGQPATVTAQDLIKRFSDGTDADHNGFVDDIAGWDFFDDDNDPLDQSSYFQAGNHGSGRAGDAAQRANDHDGSLGTCPHCQILPIRIWDTFVSDGNTFAQGILYATDNDAKVIEGANGSLDHTAFAQHASEYAYQQGVVQTYSGDDLNTANHNYPANYGHAMLIEGTVPDTVGLGMDCAGGQPFCDFVHGAVPAFGSNAPVRTFFRGANTTQFGGKSSISMEGATGSINTGKASGAAGLVVSAALDKGIALRPDEARAILEQTAEDVTPGNTAGAGNPDPAGTGWDSHFGWGRPDLGKAVSVAASTAKIPDEAAIDTPDWYTPVTGKTLQVTGRVDARFSAGHKLHYKLEWGAGQAPSTWKTVANANATGPLTGLGSIDLDQVRAAVAAYNVPLDPAGPTFSPTSPSPFQNEFTVRLTVTDPANGNRVQGIDRRIFNAIRDPDLRSKAGYPKRLGTGGESQPRYSDLNADNVPELIVPTEDGTIHAYEPDGRELRGWPVHTKVQWTANDHLTAPGMKAVVPVAPPREAPRGPAVADLDGDGEPEVITVAGINVYVFEPDGTLRKGFPVSSNRKFCGPALEQQGDEDHGIPALHPKCGFVASPAVGHLEGRNGPPSIVIPGLDGHVYALRPDGTNVPHFPRLLQDGREKVRQLAESINGAAIVDLNKDGFDDLIAATNEAYGASSGEDVSFAGLLGNAAGQSTRVYAVNGKTGAYMPGWPIKIAGIIQDVLPFIGPGTDPAVGNVGGTRVFTSATSGALSSYLPDGSVGTTMRQEAFGPASNATDRSPSLNLFEAPVLGKLTPASVNPDVVKYELTASDAVNLLLVGQNVPYNHLIGAWSSATGDPRPAFPTITDDFQFVSSSLVAKVVKGSASNQVLAGNGLGMIHAYDGVTGQDVARFPKSTGGWVIAQPALADDGTRMAAITREGFLFEWSLPTEPCQTEWPTYRHDNQNTGNYNADGAAPAAPAGVSLRSLGGGRYHLSFTSPGDDRLCGTPARYRTLVDGKQVDLGLGKPVAGGKTVSKDVTLPAGAGALSVQAADDGKPGDGSQPKEDVNPGNLGQAATVAVPPAHVPRPPCKGAAPSSSIKKTALHVSHRRIRLYGRAVGARCRNGKAVRTRVRRVQVSVARVSRGRCRFLGANGRLGKRVKCAKRRYLTAHLTSGVGKQGRTRWSLKRRVHLSNGRYLIASRAFGAPGLVERTARSSNSAGVTLR
jgi:Subtilase family